MQKNDKQLNTVEAFSQLNEQEDAFYADAEREPPIESPDVRAENDVVTVDACDIALSEDHSQQLQSETDPDSPQNDGDVEQTTSVDESSIFANASADSAVDITDVVVQDAAVQQPSKVARGKLGRIVDIGLWGIIALLVVALCLRLFVFGRINISGESMTNYYYDTPTSDIYNKDLTFYNGDVVWVNKTAKPERGKVAVFFKQQVANKFLAVFGGLDGRGDDYEKLIKRIVALEGDKLWVEPTDNGLYRLCVQIPDGTLLHEDYYTKSGKVLDEKAFWLHATTGNGVLSGLGCLKDTTESNPYTVPQGCFFAMGDNRINSTDSRGVLGSVPYDRLYGIVI